MGSKSDTGRAFADLDHALAALGDGAGHEVWGPGEIINHMGCKDWRAAAAFSHAASVSFHLLNTRTPARMIAEMRTLAPVLLGLLLSAEETDAEEVASLFENVSISSEG